MWTTMIHRSIGAVVMLFLSTPPLAAQPPDPTSPPPTTQSDPATQKPEPPKEAAPEHPHTGWATLLKDSAGDFVAFPQRPSTWTILGIGGAAALAAHAADDYVHDHMLGNESADRFFVAGKWIGSVEVQVGTAVGL